MKKLLFCCFLCFYGTFVHADSKFPVDISYMVSDFKYSQEHGLKICEVQHGALSALNGDIYVTGGIGCISPLFSDFFDSFSMNKWVAGLPKLPMRNTLNENGWALHHSIRMLLKNPEFQKKATLHPDDPTSIASYGGIVYATNGSLVKEFNQYRKTYPGILFIDAAILPYWIDKYKMNELFIQNDELKKYKADCELYPKKYDPNLADRIQENMPSEMYVIKPRGEFKGNGIIIVASEDLDSVLKMILQPKSTLKNHPDESYAYWWKNTDKTFLIEKFYRSDYLNFSQKLSENADPLSPYDGEGYHYDATMRIVFILKYDNGNMTYHYLGSYWKLPKKALEEEGTHNDKRISWGAPPFYRAVDPEILAEANAQLEVAMLLLYDIMLTGSSQ